MGLVGWQWFLSFSSTVLLLVRVLVSLHFLCTIYMECDYTYMYLYTYMICEQHICTIWRSVCMASMVLAKCNVEAALQRLLKSGFCYKFIWLRVDFVSCMHLYNATSTNFYCSAWNWVKWIHFHPSANALLSPEHKAACQSKRPCWALWSCFVLGGKERLFRSQGILGQGRFLYVSMLNWKEN